MHDFNVSLLDDEAGFMGSSPCLSICPDRSLESKAESEVTLADVHENPEWKDKAEIEYAFAESQPREKSNDACEGRGKEL